MISRTQTVLLALAALAGVIYLTNSAANSATSYTAYGDVESDAYYADAVGWMRNQGITTGITPGCFGPDAKVTRGQFVVMLWRAAGEPQVRRDRDFARDHNFVDVTADWQQDAVSWANRRRITTGTTPTTFSPDTPISRGDLVTMMWRWKKPQARRGHNFVDVTAQYQQKAVSWASRQGITMGTSPTTFSPDAAATRAETAVFIWRLRGEPKPRNVAAAQACDQAKPAPTPQPGQTPGSGPTSPGNATTAPAAPYVSPPGSTTANRAVLRLDPNLAERTYEGVPQSGLSIGMFTASGTSSPKDANNGGIWHTRCASSHYAYDDPIVYPGQPGASHLHMFWGNTAADGNTTYSSLLNSGGSTCGRRELNRTAYWAPALMDGDGRVIPADQITVYYAGGRNTGPVAMFPDNLRMIADRVGADGSGNTWSCGHFGSARDDGSGNASSYQPTIPDCDPATYSHVQFNLNFPRCWDGVNLDSADHRSHMAYFQGDIRNGSCPASHPVEVPQVKYRLLFRTDATPSPSSEWSLASDAGNPPGSSLHADWWGGWNRETLDLLTNECINARKSCGSEPLGDGRYIDHPGLRYRGPALTIGS